MQPTPACSRNLPPLRQVNGSFAKRSYYLGFTLVELLVVVGIIGLLASLMFPAIATALNAAKRAQTLNLINNVKTGILSYYTDYGTYPYDNGTQSVGTSPSTNITLGVANAYTILTGGNTAVSTCTNTRGTVYCIFSNKDLNSATSPTFFVDPWNKYTGQNITIAVDGNYVNQLGSIPNTSSSSAGSTVTLNGTVAIWSAGIPTNSTVAGINTKPSKFVTTW